MDTLPRTPSVRTCTEVTPTPVTLPQVTVLTFPRLCRATEADMPDDDIESIMKRLKEASAEKTNPCPVTWRTEDGRGTWRGGREEGHNGEHEGPGTNNGAYVRRIAERISENLCVGEG